MRFTNTGIFQAAFSKLLDENNIAGRALAEELNLAPSTISAIRSGQIQNVFGSFIISLLRYLEEQAVPFSELSKFCQVVDSCEQTINKKNDLPLRVEYTYTNAIYKKEVSDDLKRELQELAKDAGIDAAAIVKRVNNSVFKDDMLVEQGSFVGRFDNMQQARDHKNNYAFMRNVYYLYQAELRSKQHNSLITFLELDDAAVASIYNIFADNAASKSISKNIQNEHVYASRLLIAAMAYVLYEKQLTSDEKQSSLKSNNIKENIYSLLFRYGFMSEDELKLQGYTSERLQKITSNEETANMLPADTCTITKTGTEQTTQTLHNGIVSESAICKQTTASNSVAAFKQVLDNYMQSNESYTQETLAQIKVDDNLIDLIFSILQIQDLNDIAASRSKARKLLVEIEKYINNINKY